MTGEHGRSELQRLLSLKDRHSFVRTYLLPAMEGGLIELTVPDKPNSRLQRYRLTAAGQAMHSALKPKE